MSLRDILAGSEGPAFAFRADQPLRYLGSSSSRGFRELGKAASSIQNQTDPGSGVDSIAVSVASHSTLRSQSRQVPQDAEAILQFYSSLMGDAPYTSAAIALLEGDLPGGHSPGYFAVINTPTTFANVNWRGDPASFENFPQFFLAHELAHQWWGQAIGWKNYHEQWISEGFAQYFAALYAQKSRGDRVFVDMLRQFRRWSLSESDQGPVHLGSRLGHVKRDPRVFRALVYNKGAAVLHMLRRLLGDEVFFRGLRRFYMDRRYQKAGTEDFERAMEAESGRVLDRFFERWIYGSGIPRVKLRHPNRRQAGRRPIRTDRGPGFRHPRHRDAHPRRRPDVHGRRTDNRSPGRALNPNRKPGSPDPGQSGFGGPRRVRGRVGR